MSNRVHYINEANKKKTLCDLTLSRRMEAIFPDYKTLLSRQIGRNQYICRHCEEKRKNEIFRKAWKEAQ